MAIHIDGIEVSSVAKFAEDKKVSGQSMTGYLTKYRVDHPDCKPIAIIGNTAHFAVSELMAALNTHKRKPKEKAPTLEEYKSMVEKHAEIMERAENKVQRLKNKVTAILSHPAFADISNEEIIEFLQQNFDEEFNKISE